MDIFNNRERKVICINNSHNMWGSTYANHMLIIGKQYTVINIDIGSFYSLVHLKEFPNVLFNSVLFKEIE